MLAQPDQSDITRRLAAMALARTRPAPAAERTSTRAVPDHAAPHEATAA